MTTQHAPGFTAARLYKKTSKNGGTYFTGRLGGVKVALLKSKDLADDGGEIWNLVFSEAAPYQPKDAGVKAADERSDAAPRASSGASARQDYARPAGLVREPGFDAIGGGDAMPF